MEQTTTRSQTRGDPDLYYGQVVIVWARWAVIFAAAVVLILKATTPDQLMRSVLMIGAMMLVNFVMHGFNMMGRPLNANTVFIASLADVVIISVIVWLAFSTQPGFQSPFFVMLYPLVAAVSFVFKPRLAVFYTLFAVGCYLAACLMATPGVFTEIIAVKALVMRAITLCAMGGLGAYFWRMQRQRREALGLTIS